MIKNNISVKELKMQKNNLQAEFEEAQEIMQDAQTMYAEKKDTLITFNNKYGRILQMIEED